MVNPEPVEGRCNHRITTKVGFAIVDISDADTDVSEWEIDHENEVELVTEDAVSAVRMRSPDGKTVVASGPHYDELQEYITQDYSPTAVAVTPDAAETVADAVDVRRMEAPPTRDGSVLPADTIIVTTDSGFADVPDDHVWLDVSEAEIRYSYTDTELEGFCERWPNGGDADYCHAHAGPGVDMTPDEIGQNRITHGMYAKRTNYWETLDAEDKQFVEAMVDSWLDDAPFDRSNVGKVNDLYRAAIDQHRAWQGVDEFVDDDEIQGLVIEEPVMTEEGPAVGQDGEIVTTLEEHPANLPLSRLTRDVTKVLKELGVSQSPDKQQADATKTLAEKLSEDDDE